MQILIVKAESSFALVYCLNKQPFLASSHRKLGEIIDRQVRESTERK